MFLKFILASLSTGAIIVTASLGWGRFSTNPRPEPLTKVHDIVIETPIGRKLANTFGVSDETNVEPINISSVAAEVAGSVGLEVQKRAQSAVLSTVVGQLIRQYGQFSTEQQKEIQTLICQPNTQ